MAIACNGDVVEFDVGLGSGVDRGYSGDGVGSDDAKAQLNPLCNSNDSVVLKSFMNVMDSAIDGWTTNSSNCCDWDGVTCNLDGKVVKLELSKKRLV
ncbi:phytosulfokine receptor 1-like protein, partial [Tanacetum coccineum]